MLHAQDTRVWVLTKTKGFRHQSIEKGREVLAELLLAKNIQVDTTENTDAFTTRNLQNNNALIFLNTTGDVYNKKQQQALVKYNQDGGGYDGIHASTDAEYDWPWSGKMAGVYFRSHPDQQETVAKVIDKSHPSIRMLPDEWKRFDEWYNFKEVDPGIMVLAKLDETCYEGGKMKDNHPHIGYHEFEGGKVFHAALGHMDETFDEPCSESMPWVVSHMPLAKDKLTVL